MELLLPDVALIGFCTSPHLHRHGPDGPFRCQPGNLQDHLAPDGGGKGPDPLGNNNKSAAAADQHYLAATNELMIMHIDLKTRRSAAFPDAALERLQDLKRDHDALPRPDAAGRAIAIRRS